MTPAPTKKLTKGPQSFSKKMRQARLKNKKEKEKKKPQDLNFSIDCSIASDDEIFSVAEFEKFLKERIKVNKKTNNLENSVTIKKDKSKVEIHSVIRFSKRYLKYLTKKFLKKKSLRDFLRVVAVKHDTYQLRYFQITNDNEDDDDE